MEKHLKIATNILKENCDPKGSYKNTLFVTSGVNAYVPIECLLLLVSSYGTGKKTILAPKKYTKSQYLKKLGIKVFNKDKFLLGVRLLSALLSPFFLIVNLFVSRLDRQTLTDIIFSTMMRDNNLGTVDDLKKKPIYKIKIAIYKFLSPNIYAFWYCYLKMQGFQRVILVDRGYTPLGELFEAACKLKLDVVTWNLGHTKNSVYLKRYSENNKKDHYCSLSDHVWNKIQKGDVNWSKLTADTHKLINKSYKRGEWWAEVGTTNQFLKFEKDGKRILNSIKKRPAKFRAIIACHILHDATFFWGSNLFKDYKDWLVSTIEAAIKSPKDIHWIIKMHPANLVKNNRDGLGEMSLEEIAIRQNFGKLPENFTILYPSDPVSALEVVKICDLVVTVRGTIGLEGMLMGKMVATAGTGRYDGRGGTLDFTTPEEYLNFINNPTKRGNSISFDKSQMSKIAVSELYIRPYTLKSFNVEFSKSKNNDPLLTLLSDPINVLQDVQSFDKYFRDNKSVELLNDQFSFT